MSTGALSPTHAAIEAVVRIEFARLIAGLARLTDDVGLAEELAQDALVAALEQWPGQGVPRNPGAWLMTVAKRRAVDQFRRSQAQARRYAEVGRVLEEESMRPDPELESVEASAEPGSIDDDLLRLVFVACHPVLSTPAQVALTLRLLGGLTTTEIARAYLVPEPTVAQRIVRAKRTLAKAGVGFAVPAPADRPERLASVLEVVYLIFNEGYAATSGPEWTRPSLCFDALRLGRVLAAIMPGDPEVHGLVALMEFQASRLAARADGGGEPVLLLDQDRRHWDRLLISRGVAALDRVAALGGSRGVFALQAAIAASHARAFRPEETDWRQIASLYGQLMDVRPSPVIELNRAVAISMAVGPEAALPLVDAVAALPALASYHLVHSVRGDLLERLGRPDEAAAEFRRAAELTDNARERALMLSRAAGPAQGGGGAQGVQ